MSLPKPTGPFHVSVVDIEADLSYSTRSSSSSKINEKKVPTSVLFRLFYPCEKQEKDTTSTSYDDCHRSFNLFNKRTEQFTSWLPDVNLYIHGYIDFLRIPRWLGAPLFKYLFGSVKCPTFNKFPLLLNLSNNKTHADNATEQTRSTSVQFPVVIFCHGLSGMRTTYSTFCTDLASYGFIVAAIEHRDGSACVASVNDHDPDHSISYLRPDLEFEKFLKEQTHAHMTNNEFLFKFRRDQLKFKVKEVEACLDVLKDIHQGKNVVNIMGKTDKSAHVAADDHFLRQFRGRFDFKNSIVTGHSFGGATALFLLQKTSYPFKCGLVYDPWMHAVDHKKHIPIPILSLQTENFHWKTNLDPIREQFDSIYSNNSSTKPFIHEKSKFLVVKGTAHQSFSDFPFIFPWITRKFKQAGSAEPSVIWQKGWGPATYDFIFEHVENDVQDELKQSWSSQRGFLNNLMEQKTRTKKVESNSSMKTDSSSQPTLNSLQKKVDEYTIDNVLIGQEAFDFLYDGIRDHF